MCKFSPSIFFSSPTRIRLIRRFKIPSSNSCIVAYCRISRIKVRTPLSCSLERRKERVNSFSCFWFSSCSRSSAGKAVLPGSAYFLIAYLHGLPAGGTVDNAVEQVIEGAGVPLHDGRAAVNQFLYLMLPLSRNPRIAAV